MGLRFSEQEANFAQQLNDVEARLTQQIYDVEARQNLEFEEMSQQIKELSERVGNLERGQSCLEGQLDIIRDAMFQRAPG